MQSAAAQIWACLWSVHAVSSQTLGCMLRRVLNRHVKTQRERVGPPTFATIIEMLTPNSLRIYTNTAPAVDALLRSEIPQSEVRTRCQDGRMLVENDSQPAADSSSVNGLLDSIYMGYLH